MVGQLALGTFITYLAYRSHKKKGSTGMLRLSIGFALITLGVVIEGILFEFLGASIFIAHMVESIAVALGLAVTLYSLFTGRSRRASSTEPIGAMSRAGNLAYIH